MSMCASFLGCVSPSDGLVFSTMFENENRIEQQQTYQYIGCLSTVC